MARFPAKGYNATRRRPYVQNVRRTRATIRWTSFNSGAASVLIRDAAREERIVECRSEEMTPEQTNLPYTYFKHTAALAGLEPATEYSYRVRLDGQVFEPEVELSFRTSGASACSFLAIGDTGTGSREQSQLAERIQKEQPGLVIHTGDIAYPTGRYETYEERYFDFYHALMRRVPFFPCPGNHDYYETRAYPYLSVHDLPSENVTQQDQGRYYSFDWGDVHFISLDSNESLSQAASGRGEMLRWLERDLAGTNKFWRIAFFHHPPYAFGPNSRDSEAARARSLIVPILDRYGVPLVLNGHEHSYQRTRPINRTVYITTGGGGAHLYPVHESNLLAAGVSRHHYLRINIEGRRLSLQALDANGVAFDETTINPAPMLATMPVVNSASFDEQISEGALISVLGWHFGVETLENAGKPLPEDRRSGVQVTVAGRELPLLMVSPTQVNAILPEGITGSAELRIKTPGGEAAAPIEIGEIAPALFSIAFEAAGVPNSAETPSTPGSTLTVFATGLSRFGGTPRLKLDAQIIPSRLLGTGFPGLASIDFTLPDSLASGMHSLRIEAGSRVSNSISISVVNR